MSPTPIYDAVKTEHDTRKAAAKAATKTTAKGGKR